MSYFDSFILTLIQLWLNNIKRTITFIPINDEGNQVLGRVILYGVSACFDILCPALSFQECLHNEQSWKKKVASAFPCCRGKILFIWFLTRIIMTVHFCVAKVEQVCLQPLHKIGDFLSSVLHDCDTNPLHIQHPPLYHSCGILGNKLIDLKMKLSCLLHHE